MIPLDAARFRRDGYLILKNLIPATVIDGCLEEIRAIFNAQAERFGVTPADSIDMASLSRTMAGLIQRDIPAYLAAAKLAQHAISLHRMGCDETLVAPLRALGLQVPIISTRPVIFFMADALKIPGGYHKTPPHQDWRSIQGSLDGVVAWVPFSSTDRFNYPLEVLPGSHQRGLLPTKEDVFGHRVEETALPDTPFTALEVERGDVVIFSCFLVHRTGEAGGALARFAASFRFNNAAEPSFVQRGYPNPYVYRPDMTILTPDFPRPAQLRRIFADAGAAFETGDTA
jgi:ectoine hydroxylase-related dioxygenase (phytanoyl-CoA dioxygenase family)